MTELTTILAGAAVGWAAAGREKPQGIRLADVFLLGPLMVWASTQTGTTGADAWTRAALGAAGAATITYNGRNYLRLQGRAEPTSYMGPG